MCIYVIVIVLVLSLVGGYPSLADKWWEPVNANRVDKGYPALRWQTSFDEFKIGRHAPVNSQACVGVMGGPVMQFGHQMHLRYSEFELRFRLDRDQEEVKPFTLEGFRQRALDGYLPAVVTEFSHAGVDYRITYMMAPSSPQPVDVIELVLSNTGQSNVKGSLLVNLDGAPTLQESGDIVEDRGKPLIILDGGPDEIRRITRDVGVVDPRCTPAGGEWSNWKGTWRDGYYGMPVEYMIKAEPEKEYQVYLATDRTPAWDIIGWGYKSPRGVILDVEGDRSKTIDYSRTDAPGISKFIGKDMDGDGYMRVSSRATPQSRQPAYLNAIWVYDKEVRGIKESDLTERKPAVSPRYYIAVGASAPPINCDIIAGEDPTWKALSLRYTPVLGPGETKRYVMKFPAIDRLELCPYASCYHPYDTNQGWMRSPEPRHPENTTPYGEDVPPGLDRAEYAAFGPKPRSLWEKQLKIAREITPEKAKSDIKAYWNKFLAGTVKFSIPDQELENLYKAQLVILGMYLYKWGEHDVYTEMEGPFFYQDMCYRDGSYNVIGLDIAGCRSVSDKLCNSLLIPKSKLPVSRWLFGQWDDEENFGMWRSRPGQWDGQGQTIAALVNHYLYTGDKKWLQSAYPAIANGARWIRNMRDKQKEALKNAEKIGYGLLPSGILEAGGEGNPYYIEAYCIYGLKKAAVAAKALGKHDDAREFLNEAEDYSEALIRAAKSRFVRFNDYCGALSVDPTDQNNLSTWPGSSLVYPLEVFDPFDLMVEGWYRFREIEASEQGGLMNFPYIFTDWAISYIRRRQPDRLVDLFYAYVDTASEMMGWSEGQELYHVYNDFNPPKTGVMGQGDMPHGEACSNYIIMLRNLLLHEEGDTLHIAPATPRRWMAQTKPFGAENAPTFFGRVSFDIRPGSDRKTINADVKLEKGPLPLGKVLLHLRTPGGRGLAEVKVNGKRWDAFAGDTVIIANPPSAMSVIAVIR